MRLCEAVRAAPGPVAIETGTGVTMTADAANVTQWLAWALMILTGSMNRPGGIWFHPGFAYQLEAFELPISPPDGSFGPGPRSRPGTQSFMGEWPCAALPDEIEAGNIRAVLNLGGSLLTSFPNTGCWSRRCASSRCWPPRRSSRTTPRRCPRTCCRPRISWNDPTSRSGTR
jgi:anaerobic selenocysteine-containing dehydrogenase